MIWGYPYFWKHPYNAIYLFISFFSLIPGILLPAYNEAILRIPIGQPSFCFMMSDSHPSSWISGSTNWIQVFLGLPIWFFSDPLGPPPQKNQYTPEVEQIAPESHDGWKTIRLPSGAISACC